MAQAQAQSKKPPKELNAANRRSEASGRAAQGRPIGQQICDPPEGVTPPTGRAGLHRQHDIAAAVGRQADDVDAGESLTALNNVRDYFRQW